MDCMGKFRTLTWQQKRTLLLPASAEELIAAAKLCGIEMTMERAQRSYELCRPKKTSAA